MEQDTDSTRTASPYFNADELVAYRKPPELPVHSSIGEKCYQSGDNDVEEAQAYLKEWKALLEVRRTARIGDLIVAEWDALLKKAVTGKLKGKFTQHMGQASKGQVTLLPEETLFLLENGFLELRHEGLPLSTEEAYGLLLTSESAYAKYRVYAHLSQLGFTVVSHQGKIEAPASLKKKAYCVQQKNVVRKKKRKRKSQYQARKKLAHDSQTANRPESCVSTVEVVTNLSDAVTDSQEPMESEGSPADVDSNSVDHTEQNNSDSLMIDLDAKTETITRTDLSAIDLTEEHDMEPSETKEDVQGKIVLSEDVTKEGPNKSIDKIISEGEKTHENPDSSSICSDESKTDDVSKHVLSETENQPEAISESKDAVVGLSGKQPIEKVALSESFEAEQSSESVNTHESEGSEQVESFDSKITTDEDHILTDEVEACEVQTIESTTDVQCEVQTIKTKTDEQIESKAVDSATDEQCEIQTVETKTDKQYEVHTIDSTTDEQCVVLEAVKTSESSEESSSNSVEEEEYESDSSESSSDDSVVRIDTENDSLDEENQDVEIIPIAKTEKTPLAVISLLSDDEKGEDSEGSINVNVSNSNEEDDDIQIINECPKSSSKTRPRLSQDRKPNILTNRKYIAPKVNVDFNNSVEWPFPNLSKKTVVCLQRPPPHLIPSNVHMKKEAYTLDLRKLSGGNNSYQTPRVWNSYKDLQARQRTLGSGFRPSPWNITEQRPFSPNRRDLSPGPSNLRPDWNRGVSSSQPSATDFMRTNEANRNQPLLPQSASPFVKSEGPSSQRPSPFLSSHSASPAPQDSFSQYVTLAATQAAAQAARNVILSMTGNMNVTINGRANPPAFNGGGNVPPFPGAFGGAGLLGEPFRNNLEIGRNNMPLMPSAFGTDFRHAALPSFQEYSPDSRNNFYPNSNSTLPPSDDGPRRGNYPNARTFSAHSTNDILFPSSIPKGIRGASSWREYKSVATEGSHDSNDADDITEVPINMQEVLWSKNLSPLVKLENMNSNHDIMKSSQITLSSKLTVRDRFSQVSCSMEIDFDVYLPTVTYKKSCPGIPSHRIVVVKASDDCPRLGDIVYLSRRFQDSASLMFAVVDDKDISFFSFAFVDLPQLSA